MNLLVLEEAMPVLALCMMRPLGVMLLLPIFNASTLGGTLTRNALVMMIAMPVVPVYMDYPVLQQTHGAWAYGLLLSKELLIGFILGFSASISFWAIDMVGFLIDTMRGASMSSVLNPLLGAQSSIFGILFSQVLTVLFLILGGFNQLLEGIYRSYQIIAPGTPLNFGPELMKFLVHEWRLMYELCLGFALPSIVVMVLIDLAMGFVNRSAQQLNVFFLAMPIKSAMVLFLLIVGLNFAFSDYVTRIRHLEKQISALMGSMR
ncbi:EscT/YscT/HrcT family type III secretion system export apparatus protein [Chitinimonas arctica]|uniref:EscT/YscT/HrcT family type III secretion system export apparatus protein n=1 Tax=Chitinimonas arctica TaxID=2594795 RepID=A0A516S9N8_9NEIS|nr:type III secretion system export apparatus subunit SctT [Chitinimonas arctica]QDQ24865.1 EscT/YscT/HrcT family type III secretion system export apparatus protein [Chitinimonas arctica]